MNVPDWLIPFLAGILVGGALVYVLSIRDDADTTPGV